MNTAAPCRIQRLRTKGWHMPDNAIYVGRPTKWGNPFPAKVRSRAEAVALYRSWIMEPTRAGLRHAAVAELGGKHLACWCPLDGGPCHADVLLEVANSTR